MKLTKVAAVFFLMFCASCAKRTPLMQPEGHRLSADEAQQTAAVLSQRGERLVSVKALYRTEIEYGGKRQSLRHAFLYQEPDMLRVEVLPRTGTYNLGLFLAHGGRAQFVDQQSQEIRESHSAKDLMAEHFGLELSTSGLITILLGMVEYPAYGTFYEAPQEGRFFTSPSGYNAALTPGDLLVSQAQLINVENDRVVLNAEYSDYRQVKDLWLPHKVKIHSIKNDFIVNLEAQFIRVNEEIDRKVFKFF